MVSLLLNDAFSTLTQGTPGGPGGESGRAPSRPGGAQPSACALSALTGVAAGMGGHTPRSDPGRRFRGAASRARGGVGTSSTRRAGPPRFVDDFLDGLGGRGGVPSPPSSHPPGRSA